jgi:hypothetical protein
MLLMFLLSLGVNQNIINKHHNELIQVLQKHLVHHVGDSPEGPLKNLGNPA